MAVSRGARRVRLGGRRRVVWSVAVATTLLVLLVSTAHSAVALPDAVRALSALAAARVLTGRAHTGRAEPEVWKAFNRGANVVTGATVLDVVANALAPQGSTWLVVAAGLQALAALFLCGTLYRGLIVWNRVRTTTTDPSDWLNGISATLAVVALGSLLLTLWGRSADPAGAPGQQLALFQVAAWVVVLGTTLTVATMGALLSDARPWLISAGVLTAMTGALATTFSTGQGWPAVGTSVLLAVLALCSRLPVRVVRPQPATTQSVTIGALVVLLASVAILVVDTRLEPDLTRWSVLWASLAVLGVSTRVVHLIRALSSLATRKQEALTDELTGLANRRAFAVALAAETSGPRALLVLDLDRFKEVNDRFGHLVGDELLQSLATRLAEEVPGSGLLTRLGGDEFAVLLRSEDELTAVALAHRLSAAASEDGNHRLSISIGVVHTDDATPGQELFRRADAAMYEAKASGTGVRVYDAGIDHESERRAALVDDLHAAWSAAPNGFPSQFEVHYQPKVSTGSGRVSGVEALVRWRHPVLGLLAPGAFLDLVEEQGLMSRLTRHVVWSAARDAPHWQVPGRGEVSVAVNLSTSCLTDPSLLPLLADVVDAGTDPARLVLEVTETTLMQDPAAALATCRLLRDRGFGLSIDDYGTGYASLAYLSDLPATELKIDRSFTSRLLSDDRVRAIIAGTVELGHQLGLRVVAEGAEDHETVAALAQLGCDDVQGYVHARPMPAGELAGWFDRRTLAEKSELTPTVAG